MKKGRMIRTKTGVSAGPRGKKLKRSLGWGLSAYGIIMKNKIVIACCLLFQGFFWVFNPKGSLEWDIMMLSVLSALYAVAGLVVLITGGNRIAERGKDEVGKLYRDTWDGKRKQLAEPAGRLSDITVIKEREEEFLQTEEKVREFSSEAKKQILTKRNFLAAGYVILIIVSIVFIIFKSFFSGVVFEILGVAITVEGVFSFITWSKTKDSVKPRDRTLSFAVAAFSVVLGIVLIVFPFSTGAIVIRFVGFCILVKATVELIVGFRNRSLISDTKDTISKIKNI